MATSLPGMLELMIREVLMCNFSKFSFRRLPSDAVERAEEADDLSVSAVAKFLQKKTKE